jgi:hypothetical protein
VKRRAFVRIFITIGLSLTLASAGAARDSWGNSGPGFVADAEGAPLPRIGEASGEVGENQTALDLACFQPTVFYSSHEVTGSTVFSSKESHSSKEDLRIYQLNRAFLI